MSLFKNKKNKFCPVSAVRKIIYCGIISSFFLLAGYHNISADVKNKVNIKTVQASTPDNPDEAGKAADGDLKTRWSSQPTDTEWIKFTLKTKTIIDKIIIYWEAAFGETYQVRVSENNKDWYVVYNAVKHKGGKEIISFAPVSVKQVMISGISRGTRWGYSIWECEIFSSEKEPIPLNTFQQPDDIRYSRTEISPSAYYYHTAQESPPGYYPQWLYKQQAYWTVSGLPGSPQEILVSEDGTIDVPAGFSLMPYLYLDKKLITAYNIDRLTQYLEKDYLPIPSVTWYYKDLEFSQKIFSFGHEDREYACVYYILHNKAAQSVQGDLFLLIRPFQVNPPWMYGGFGSIYHIKKQRDIIQINKKPRILSLNSIHKFGVMKYEQGDIIEKIKQDKIPLTQEIEDLEKLASGAMGYEFKLDPGEKKQYILIVCPDRDPVLDEKISFESIEEKLKGIEEMWQEKLDKPEINIPDKYLVNVFRSSLAYIMINYDGSAFIPGPRNYERSWVRDGCIMAAALLRAGQYQMVKKYIQWLLSYQKPSGEIPCILDTAGNPRGEKEYDNQGEFLFTVGEYYRFSHDLKFIKEIFPSLIKAVKFIQNLREQRMTRSYTKTGFYGILPLSISHEGFPEPEGAHSYYDDWYALKGLKDVYYLAAAAGENKSLKWIRDLETDLRTSLLASIELTMQNKNIQFIPSSAEGHQDACGNAVTIWPTEENRYLPDGLIEKHLDSWYKHVFLPERKAGIKYNFTPYELRMANAYLILGRKKEALEMLRFFLSVTRPKNWNHWAECIACDQRAPVYLGDMPHTWISAIYVNTVRNMFVYEKDNQLVLGAGIDEKWLDTGEGISINHFLTYFGETGYSVKRTGNELQVNIFGNADPEKGFAFVSPFMNKKIKKVMINGKSWTDHKDNWIFFNELPVKITVTY